MKPRPQTAYLLTASRYLELNDECNLQKVDIVIGIFEKQVKALQVLNAIKSNNSDIVQLDIKTITNPLFIDPFDTQYKLQVIK